MTDCVLVVTTTGDHALAERIATALVDARLAACVQMSGPVRSLFRWQGQVESAEEFVVTAKTTSDQVTATQALISELHNYDVPELIVVPITGGSAAYLNWVRGETHQ